MQPVIPKNKTSSPDINPSHKCSWCIVFLIIIDADKLEHRKLGAENLELFSIRGILVYANGNFDIMVCVLTSDVV